jgi:hypothetical protein
LIYGFYNEGDDVDSEKNIGDLGPNDGLRT